MADEETTPAKLSLLTTLRLLEHSNIRHESFLSFQMSLQTSVPPPDESCTISVSKLLLLVFALVMSAYKMSHNKRSDWWNYMFWSLRTLSDVLVNTDMYFGFLGNDDL